jgi:hypothetical protein
MRKIIFPGCFLVGIILGGCSNPAEPVTDTAQQPATESTASAIELSSDVHEGC